MRENSGLFELNAEGHEQREQTGWRNTGSIAWWPLSVSRENQAFKPVSDDSEGYEVAQVTGSFHEVT